jgi:hypothetical protein
MNILVMFSSSYFSLIDSVNSSIMPNPMLKPSSERINNTLFYYFSNVNPFESELFLNSNENDYLNVDLSGFLGSQSFSYTHEFKFPYYYYYYTADFENISLESDEVFNKNYLINSLSGLDVNYDIVYFGELINTNGEKLDDNKVRFSVSNPKDYNLTFKEFFLTN